MISLNKSSYVILGLLSKSDYSGYSLKRIMKKTSDFYWSESNAQIYPVLKKLEELKFVTSKIDETSGARYKRVFSITKKGLSELMNWLEHDCDLALYREEFLLQLSLGQHLAKSKLLKKISYYQKSIATKLEKLNDIIKHIKIDHAGKADQQYLLLTYDHIKCVLESKLKWCNKTLSSMS
jgi:DNA-binding PadR family transcriptional regulator